MTHETAQLEFASHFIERYHAGIPGSWSHRSSLASAHCGDEVTLSLAIEDCRICEAWHEVRGCLVCQAAASFLCRWSEGQVLSTIAALTEQEFLAHFPAFTPLRQQCALLQFRCLKVILTSKSRAPHESRRQ